MKRFKIVYLLLSLWLCFSAHALGRSEHILKHVYAHQVITASTQQNAYHKHGIKLLQSKPGKNTYLGQHVYKGLKKKATQSYNNLLPKIYQSDFVLIKGYSDSLIYGITVKYSVALHTYLHLYQLF